MNLDELTEAIVSDVYNKIVSETSRRQKAVKNFLGVNNKVKTFGIITGENPMGVKMDKQENDKRNGMLKSFLNSRQYSFYPVKGKYGNIEHPFMVYNVSIDDIKTIGRTFDQESFIYAEIVYQNEQPHIIFSYNQKDFPENEKTFNGSKLKPSQRDYCFIESKETYIQLDSEPEDYFTAIGRNFKFSIPFDIFNEAIDRYNSFLNERCEMFDNYKLMCDKLINESIQEDMTDKGRRIRRAKLYGKNFEKFYK